MPVCRTPVQKGYNRPPKYRLCCCKFSFPSILVRGNWMFPENSGWCGLVWTSLELKDQNLQSSRRPRKDNIILSVSDRQQSVILFRGLMSLCTCPREWI